MDYLKSLNFYIRWRSHPTGHNNGKGKGGAIFVQDGATVIAEGSLTFGTVDDNTNNNNVYGIITPIVSITSDSNPDEDGPTPANFTLSRPTSLETHTVSFTVGGTATFLYDYTVENATNFNGTGGKVVIPENTEETNITLTITPIDDDIVDYKETIQLILSNGNGTGYQVSNTQNSASMIIRDNDFHPVATGLSLETNHATILDGGSLTIFGKLSRFPYLEKHDLSNEEVILTVVAPDGKLLTKGSSCIFKETLTDDEKIIISSLEKDGTFSHIFAENSCFKYQTAGGKYKFKVSFNQSFIEAESEFLLGIPSDDNPEAVEPEVSVLVGQSAGYVLLIQGQIKSDLDGSKAYNKTTNRIYQKLINRGFEDENIYYFNFNTGQAGVDGIPENNAIQTALEDLKGRSNNSPAQLYIIMVNHGGKNGHFYINNGNNEEIMANDLSDWLNSFEAGLNLTALKQPRVAIIGSCYSGSFIESLSKIPSFSGDTLVDAGRIIIASASAEEESYKGPQEDDGIRSGEFFMEELFQQLGQGESLKTSFEYAVERTETLTHRDDANATVPFYDQAAQHPLLDDNGDKKGSNLLFMGQQQDGKMQDGQIAQNTYLGVGQIDPNEARITEVTDTIYLDANTSTTELFASVNNAARVIGNKVIVNIRPPNFILKTGDGSGKQVEIDNFIEGELPCNSTTECKGNVGDFNMEGQYEVYYFVRDTNTNNISLIKQSIVYKDKVGNNPPGIFSLNLPANNDENQKTIILFDWKISTDGDSNIPVTYNLLLSEPEDFSTIAYRREGLTTTMTYIDKEANVVRDDEQTGLKDQTTYYWKVQAVDSNGSITESTKFLFKTNNTNAPPSIGSLHISSALDFTAIDGAEISLLDEFDKQLPDPEMFQDQGNYNMLLPHGRRRAKIRVTGYQEQEIYIDTTQGKY